MLRATVKDTQSLRRGRRVLKQSAHFEGPGYAEQVSLSTPGALSVCSSSFLGIIMKNLSSVFLDSPPPWSENFRKQANISLEYCLISAWVAEGKIGQLIKIVDSSTILCMGLFCRIQGKWYKMPNVYVKQGFCALPKRGAVQRKQRRKTKCCEMCWGESFLLSIHFQVHTTSTGAMVLFNQRQSAIKNNL